MKAIVKQKTRLEILHATARIRLHRFWLLENSADALAGIARRNPSVLRTRINTGYFSILKTAPLNASCHACAIIPGRRLFRHHASNPNINPKIAIKIIRAMPS